MYILIYDDESRLTKPEYFYGHQNSSERAQARYRGVSQFYSARFHTRICSRCNKLLDTITSKWKSVGVIQLLKSRNWSQIFPLRNAKENCRFLLSYKKTSESSITLGVNPNCGEEMGFGIRKKVQPTLLAFIFTVYYCWFNSTWQIKIVVVKCGHFFLFYETISRPCRVYSFHLLWNCASFGSFYFYVFESFFTSFPAFVFKIS